MTNPRDVIIRPIVSEKSMAGMRQGKYTFRVAPEATRTEIKRAVEEIFKVRVSKVNTVNVAGKFRRMGVHTGYTPSWKKAVVTLEPGQSIKFFEGMM